MDTLSRAERSARMALVRSRDTKPEIRVRSAAHRAGFRYRLHVAGLPGRPDLVFPSARKIIFVHGCFWHRHPGCPQNRTPKSRRGFWVPKLRQNRLRDRRVIRRLQNDGWKVEIIWECETTSPRLLRAKLRRFLGRK